MNFVYPIFIYILPFLIVGLFYFFKKNFERYKNRIDTFSSFLFLRSNFSGISYKVYAFKQLCMCLAVICFFIALSRPQYGYVFTPIQAKGVDILFALDTSKSMLAEDIKPNRISRVKLALRDFVQNLSGDKVGLIAFAGNAFLECPLTLDYSIFLETLDACHVGIIQQGGTDFAAAIDQAIRAFDTDYAHKILVILSDGEDLEKTGCQRAIQAKEEGIIIYTIGVGTAAGDIIPFIDSNGSLQYVKDTNQKLIKSSLNESTLKSMAEVTDGAYAPLGHLGQGLKSIYTFISNKIPPQDRLTHIQKIPLEYFSYFVYLGLFFLFLETGLLIKNSNFSWILKISKMCLRLNLYMQKIFFISLILISSLTYLNLKADDGLRYYNEKNYEQSEKFYQKQLEKNPKNSLSNYNLACVLYQQEKYAAAQLYFEKSLDTEDEKIQEKIFYNLGNTHFLKHSINGDTDYTISCLNASIQAYENALHINPENQKSKHNLELAKRKLEETQNNQNKPKDTDSNNKLNQDISENNITNNDSNDNEKKSSYSESREFLNDQEQEEKTNSLRTTEGHFQKETLTQKEAKDILEQLDSQKKLFLQVLGSQGVPTQKELKNTRDW